MHKRRDGARLQRVVISTLVLGSIGITGAARAGDLNPPPGAVAPTNRVQFNQQTTPMPLTIGQPGSYELTSNMEGSAAGTDGIKIIASDVTLDLRGFRVRGGTGTLNGIVLGPSVQNVRIINGTIENWGAAGIDATRGTDCVFEDLEIILSGGAGIDVGNGHTIRTCNILDSTGDGIHALGEVTVTQCRVLRSGGNGAFLLSQAILEESYFARNDARGISAGTHTIVRACESRQNSTDGISVGEGSSVINCVSSGNFRGGILGGIGCSILDSTVSNNSGDGIWVFRECLVRGCEATSNSSASQFYGIHIAGSNNRVESNHLANNLNGIIADADSNIVRDNTVIRTGITPYSFANGNQLELIVSELPQTISWPALVTVSGSLTGVANQNGITVQASDVTIDLNGHELVGVTNSLSGIAASVSGDRLVVRNGTIRNWGSGGISVSSADSVLVENVQADSNSSGGIATGTNADVRSCVASNNGSRGFDSFGSTRYLNCVAQSNSSTGFFLGANDTIHHCKSIANGFHGIRVSRRCSVTDNEANNNTGDGILVQFEDNRIDGNMVVTNTANGISVAGAGNLITRNSASGNTPNYTISGGNQAGPIGSAATSTSAWTNFSY